uniref:Uncharacterized protein n=1 Tax=Iridovirus Liz-CrIV TaxID=2594309 RepID=A0A5B8RI14_9VIRU|nr:putative protein 138R [Iridovirus Liz-CrIV]
MTLSSNLSKTLFINKISIMNNNQQILFWALIIFIPFLVILWLIFKNGKTGSSYPYSYQETNSYPYQQILTAPIQLDTDLDSCNNQLDTLRQQIQAEETKLKNKNTQLATCRSNVTKAIAQLKDAKARSGR